jgi:ketosteroid isomerase-like protein
MVATERDTARAMSQENVEIVRAAYDAYNRGDLDSTLKETAPEAELDWSRGVGPQRPDHAAVDNSRRRHSAHLPLPNSGGGPGAARLRE